MGIGIISSFGAVARCYFQVKKISMAWARPEPVLSLSKDGEG